MKRIRTWWLKFRRVDEVRELKQRLESVLRELDLAKLQVDDLEKRLALEREQTFKAKSHSQKMWNFIALRHRIDLPARNGTIRKVLQQAERKR